ncbi:hypothetical protein Tco_0188000, partial [Tanacetum coccineum]
VFSTWMTFGVNTRDLGSFGGDGVASNAWRRRGDNAWRTDRLKRLYKVGLTARVESSKDEGSLSEDASKQGRINAIDADEDISLVNDQYDADMFDVNTLTGDEVLAEKEDAAKDVNLTVDEVTLAQALAALKSVKPKVKANIVEEPSVPVSAASTKVSCNTPKYTIRSKI